MSELVAVRRSPQLLAASLCLGLAAANAVRVNGAVALVLAALVGSAALGVLGPQRLLLVAGALALLGWCWGSNRLDALDRSPLSSRIDTAERAQLVVTGPVHAGKFDIRTPALVKRFGRLTLREPVLLKLPRGRAPPQGAILEALVIVTAPRGPENGFDERTWLRRHGVHVVLRVDEWRIVGRRGGIGGIADAVRRRLRHSVARGLHGERAAVIEGVVLGEDNGLSDELRRSFRASGLYHLLAVSGQNVALVAASAVLLTWLLGLPRLLGELGALAAIGAYVLAVGAQPSVIRAGVAGALGSVAWLTARAADRWHHSGRGAPPPRPAPARWRGGRAVQRRLPGRRAPGPGAPLRAGAPRLIRTISRTSARRSIAGGREEAPPRRTFAASIPARSTSEPSSTGSRLVAEHDQRRYLPAAYCYLHLPVPAPERFCLGAPAATPPAIASRTIWKRLSGVASATSSGGTTVSAGPGSIRSFGEPYFEALRMMIAASAAASGCST